MVNYTALCAAIKPREIFESAAKRHFQKFLSNPKKQKRRVALPFLFGVLCRSDWRCDNIDGQNQVIF
jgi:hypothetical protein